MYINSLADSPVHTRSGQQEPYLNACMFFFVRIELKAIGHLVTGTTTFVSPADVKVAGAASATLEAVQVDQNSTPDTSKKIGLFEPQL